MRVGSVREGTVQSALVLRPCLFTRATGTTAGLAGGTEGASCISPLPDLSAELQKNFGQRGEDFSK